jgi:hypothetical protein
MNGNVEGVHARLVRVYTSQMSVYGIACCGSAVSHIHHIAYYISPHPSHSLYITSPAPNLIAVAITIPLHSLSVIVLRRSY